MTDLSGLTDDQLNALLAGQGTVPPPAPAAALPGQLSDPAHPLASAMAADAPANSGADITQLSDQQLNALLATQPTPQMQGWKREVALPASAAAKGALTSLGGPADAVALYDKYVGVPTNKAVAWAVKHVAPGLVTDEEPAPAVGFDNPWSSSSLLNTGRTLGLVDRPDLTPQGLREEYESAAAQGTGAALPYALTGGVGGLTRTLAGGAGAGIGAHGAEDLAPAHPLAAALLGAGTGMLAGGGAYDVAARGTNLVRGEVSPLVEAYHRMQVEPQLVGDVSQRPFWQQYSAYLAKAPGSAGTMEHAADEAVGQFGDAVDRVASGVGTAQTGQQAGQALQDAARDWYNTRWPQAETAAWEPVNSAIPKTADVPLTNYEQALNQVTAQAGRLTGSANVLLPQKAQALLDDLHASLTPATPTAPGFFTTLRSPTTPALQPATWAEAQRLRSLIGEARGVPEISQSLGTQNLNRMYAALSEDMRGTARAAGVEDEFDAANRFSTAGHAFMENTLSKIISSPRNPLQESIAPAQAADNVLNGGDRTLLDVRAHLPQGADELAAWKLRDAGLALPGRQNAAGTQISPTTFATDMAKLEQQAPHGYDALFQDVRPEIGDLRSISQSMRETSARVNTSGTGPHNEFAGMLPRAFVGAEIGDRLFGVPGAAVGAGVGAFGPPVLNRAGAAAMTSRPLARYMSTPIAPWTARQALISTLEPAYAEADGRTLPPPTPANR